MSNFPNLQRPSVGAYYYQDAMGNRVQPNATSTGLSRGMDPSRAEALYQSVIRRGRTGEIVNLSPEEQRMFNYADQQHRVQELRQAGVPEMAANVYGPTTDWGGIASAQWANQEANRYAQAGEAKMKNTLAPIEERRRTGGKEMEQMSSYLHELAQGLDLDPEMLYRESAEIINSASREALSRLEAEAVNNPGAAAQLQQARDRLERQRTSDLGTAWVHAQNAAAQSKGNQYNAEMGRANLMAGQQGRADRLAGETSGIYERADIVPPNLGPMGELAANYEEARTPQATGGYTPAPAWQGGFVGLGGMQNRQPGSGGANTGWATGYAPGTNPRRRMVRRVTQSSGGGPLGFSASDWRNSGMTQMGGYGGNIIGNA